MGYRAEDAALARNPPIAQITTPIYSDELLSDGTMITVKVGGGFVSAKTDKDFRQAIRSQFSLYIQPYEVHLFDSQTQLHVLS